MTNSRSISICITAGRIRGLYLMGSDCAKPVFEEWMKPFNEMGAKTLTLVSRGSTDHVSFYRVGCPDLDLFRIRGTSIFLSVRVHTTRTLTITTASRPVI